jgi:hypothetical protein
LVKVITAVRQLYMLLTLITAQAVVVVRVLWAYQ